MTDVMRIATGQFREPTDDLLQFAAQMGVSGVVLNTPNLPGDTHWEFMDLLHLRTRCEAYGLRLESIENVPNHFYQEAMLGLPGRDEQIANYQTTIRHMGEAGIPIPRLPLDAQWRLAHVAPHARTWGRASDIFRSHAGGARAAE